MNLLILGGYSDYNTEWVKDVKETFGSLFDSSETLQYQNWFDYKEDADLRPEVENIKKIAEGKENLVVFARSVGVALALQAIYNGYIKPVKCVFAGIAYEWSKQNGWDLDVLLKDFSIPTLFIQQTNDLSTPFKTVENVLIKSNVNNYKLIELPGEDHKYKDMQELKNHVESFIKNN